MADNLRVEMEMFWVDECKYICLVVHADVLKFIGRETGIDCNFRAIMFHRIKNWTSPPQLHQRMLTTGAVCSGSVIHSLRMSMCMIIGASVHAIAVVWAKRIACCS